MGVTLSPQLDTVLYWYVYFVHFIEYFFNKPVSCKMLQLRLFECDMTFTSVKSFALNKC